MNYEKRELSLTVLIPIFISLLAWSVIFGMYVWRAHAVGAGLTSVSDTLTDSDLGVGANHTIAYTNGTTTLAAETVRITFDPTTDRFNGIQSLIMANVSTTGMTLVTTCTGAASEVQFSTSTGVGDESIIFTVCAGDTISTGSKSVFVGNTVLTNPTSTNSYVIRIDAGNADITDTRVAILEDVQLSASVDTSFTFTVSGVATGTAINGVTTTRASASTTLNFGTLPVGSPVTMGHLLNVSTNARNGFVVTVFEDQNPLSQTGADIDLFRDGNATTTPSAWVAPSNTLNQEHTFGHIGLTSDDGDLNSDEFGSALFAGNFQSTTTRQIFSATGTADGVTANVGSTTIAYRIQIGSLQEAATDYTNQLTYIATPTF